MRRPALTSLLLMLLLVAPGGCGDESGREPATAGGIDLLLEPARWSWSLPSPGMFTPQAEALFERDVVLVTDEQLTGWMRLPVEAGDVELWGTQPRHGILDQHLELAALARPGRELRRMTNIHGDYVADTWAVSPSGYCLVLPAGQQPATGYLGSYPASAARVVGDLANASGSAGESPRTRLLKLGGDQREALLLPPPSAVVCAVRVPDGGLLEVGLGHGARDLEPHQGVLRQVAGAGDGVGFRIAFHDADGARHQLLDRFFAPSLLPGSVEVSVDLSPWQGTSGRIELSTYGSPDTAAEQDHRGDFAFFTEPRITPAPRADDPPSVLIVLVDTLRADALGCYGNQRGLTPQLDALAAQGALFAGARSASSWTLPAHSSLFTSLFPSQHGANGRLDRLEDGFVTLAEVLREAGWRTAAFTDGGYVSPTFGLGQGFSRFDSSEHGVRPVVERASRWIRGRRGPFFAFVQTYEVHDPYQPPEEYRARFVRDYDGDLPDVVGFSYPPFAGSDPQLGPDDRRYLRDLYDAGVAYTDAVLGEFFESMRAAGDLDDVLVVVVSDHGEEFFEHGGYGHGLTLYEEQLKIPLLVRYPRVFEAGSVIDEPVRLVDVAPTVLEIAGVSQPPQWCGVSLTDMDSPRDQFWTLAYLEDPSLVSSAVLRGDRKWIQTPDGVHHRGGSPPRHQLFDLRSDAGEQSSLWRAPLQAEWEQALGAMLEAHPDLRSAGGLQARPSREEVEALKGLGY